MGGDFYEKFFALMHDGSLADYRERFEHLANRVEGFSETALEENFMKGLKLKIRAAMKVMRPRDLGEAMELTQLVENQRNQVRGTRSKNSGGTYRMTITLLAPKGLAAEDFMRPPGIS
ncbi:hypothetical protein KFK09_005413 [Dendrobium nobile]|uniref:Retrotransposon gag domain-containing protein n=1 Tax=Dendrobium nobile TaxID=94219 RepID=A0A8T3C0I0_DENNO|nr:hypothetical protein KFK09_005413 [Dendrobium nobile]